MVKAESLIDTIKVSLRKAMIDMNLPLTIKCAVIDRLPAVLLARQMYVPSSRAFSTSLITRPESSMTYV